MRTLLLTGLFGLFALAASAADVTGKWMVSSAPGAQDLTFNFEQSGSDITGTVTTGQGEQKKISEGKVDGDNITFKIAVVDVRGHTLMQEYKGTVSGNEIWFSLSAGRGTVEFKVKKQ